MADMRLRAIIDASIDKLKSALRIAKGDIKDFGKSAGKAGDEGSHSMKELLGALTGMGSQMAVIAKGFESLKRVITFYLIDPLREAVDMAMRLGKLNTTTGEETSKAVSERAKQMADDLRAYKDFVRSMDGSNASEEKRRQMARDIDAKYFNGEKTISKLSGGIKGDELDRTIADQLKVAQQSQLRALENSLAQMKREQEEAMKILSAPDIDRTYDRTGNRVVDAGLAGGAVIQKVVDGVQVSVDQVKAAAARSEELTKKIAEAGMALASMRKEGDWGEDFLTLQHAIDRDEAAKRSLAYEDRLKAFSSGGEKYDSREEEEAAIRREAKALDRLAQSEEQRADVREAFDARMADAEERWTKAAEEAAKKLEEENEEEARKKAEAYQKQLAETQKAANDLANAQRAYIDSIRDLARTEREIRDDRKKEREDERLAALERKRASYGFSIADGFSMHESASDRRKRLAQKELDASIGEKMAQWEAGESVRWTTKERRRLAGAQGVLDEQERIEARRERRDRRKAEQGRADAIAIAIGNVASARMGVVNYSQTLSSMEGYLANLSQAASTNVYFVK